MKAISAWLKKIKQQTERSDKQKGVALVVTLLVMLVLLLLALSLTLQSQTEYIIAVNEQDSMVALSFAEGILDRGNRAVKDYMAQSPGPSDLTDFLEGPDRAPGGGDDNLPDFNEFTTVDLAGGWSALAALTTGNEKTTAVKVSKDFGFGDGSKDYLAYRRGVDTTSPADGVWDGPRSVVYVRFDDNYDTGTTLDTTDNDFRMRMRVVSEYPYHADSSGAFVDKFFLTAKQRGLAQRKLIADFAPAGHVAIRTDGDLNIGGSLELCGECGGAHANGTINVGLDGGGTCAELSGTEGYTVDASAGPFLNAPVVQTGEVFIPIINPWDDRYVPDPGVFKTFSNNTIPANLRCPTNGADRSTDDDPGATKYFALVEKK